MGNEKLEARTLQGTSCMALYTCNKTGVSGLHLLAGLGYDHSLAQLLQAGADPSCQVQSPKN